MMSAMLSIDQGTTSSRVIAFNRKGEIICSSGKEHQQIYPQSGWVEHNAKEILDNVKMLLKEVYLKTEALGYNPVTIGITNQRETVVAWNSETGEILHNAIVWQDKRTASFCKSLDNETKKIITEKTGLPVDPYFSATKISWLIEHVSSIKKAETEKKLAVGTIDSFLLWHLSDKKIHATDITNASRTLLFNIHKHEWDVELLDIFNIPENILPTVHPNTFDFTMTKEGILPESLPIQAMAGDQQSAAIGQACIHKGELKSTYGTGCFAILNTGKKPVASKNGLITTIAYQLDKDVHYALEGSIFVAGSLIQWLRDKLNIIENAKETENIARNAPHKDNIYFVPAFNGLGAPYWDSDAKGAILGLTLDSDRSTIIRAALESISYQTHDLIQAMEKDLGRKITSLRVDGGMVANNWLLEHMSDILDIQLERPEVIETTALGVAFLAGLQHGLFLNLEDVRKIWQKNANFTPQMNAKKREQVLKGWQNAIAKVKIQP